MSTRWPAQVKRTVVTAAEGSRWLERVAAGLTGHDRGGGRRMVAARTSTVDETRSRQSVHTIRRRADRRTSAGFSLATRPLQPTGARVAQLVTRQPG